MQNPQTLDRYDSQRSRLPTLKGNNAHHNSSVDVISGLVQLRQQLDELGMTRFSSAIGAVRDIVSTITRDRDNENAFEEIYDLCEQLDVLLIQPLKEGKATNMVENIVEITRDLEDIVTKYHKEFAGLHHYPELLEKVPINFLESLAHLLYQSLDIAKSNVPEELYRVVEVMESTGQDFRDTSRSVQHINAQTTDIQQMADSSHRDSTLSGGTFASAPSLVHLDLSGKIDHGKRIALGNFSDVWHGTFVTDAGNVEVAIKALRVKQSRNQTAGEDRLSKIL
ncbi:hypothetical protein FRC03_009217 [Tulasnella sp. 419]|nr:hypothetical protein FRC03_009217 [Tulasnella sp. 419]